MKPARLHRPWRALIAVVEVVLAAGAVWAAFPVWRLGVKTLTVTLSDGTVLTSTRFVGSWMTGAIALGLVAAILLVDAVREVVLGVRAPRRSREEVAHLSGA
jgi:hypothetical protein